MICRSNPQSEIDKLRVARILGKVMGRSARGLVLLESKGVDELLKDQAILR